MVSKPIFDSFTDAAQQNHSVFETWNIVFAAFYIKQFLFSTTWDIYLTHTKNKPKIMNCQKTKTGNIPSPLLAGERDRLKVLEGWERPPSCLDRGRGGASGPAKFKCHAQESEFPDIQLPNNRIFRYNRESPWLQRWKFISRILSLEWKQHARDGSGANISPSQR